MRPPWSYPAADYLFAATRECGEQFAVLAQANCLTPRALADRSSVVALLTRVQVEFEAELARIGSLPPGSEGPQLTAWMHDALREAGYLHAPGWSAIAGVAGESCSTLHQVVTAIRRRLAKGWRPEVDAATLDPSRRFGASYQRGGSLACGYCGGQLVSGSRYCGYCGFRVVLEHRQRNAQPAPPWDAGPLTPPPLRPPPDDGMRVQVRVDGLLPSTLPPCRRCALEAEIDRCISATLAPPQHALDELAQCAHAAGCQRAASPPLSGYLPESRAVDGGRAT